MSDTPPKQVLPRQIDPRKFAQQGVHLSGDMDTAVLARLRELVCDSGGPARVELAFAVDEQRARTLTGAVDCRVAMVCQRCLEPVAVDLHCDINLVLVWDEEGARQLPRRVDPWIVGEGPADLYEVLEEELLLALPTVAYHDTNCIDPALLSSVDTAEGDPVPAAGGSNPFKVLEQLKVKGSPES